jgi:hypothetical protein
MMPALPAIQFPLLGNSLVVGLFSLLHIAVAGLSIGFMILSPLFEWEGRRNPNALTLAHSLTRFTLIVFSASTVLAVIMVELLIGLFPVTTMWVWNQFHAPVILGIGAFLLQLLLLYPYYHYWDHIISRQPGLHLTLGACAAFFMLIWVLVLDGMGSYMLTPVGGHGSWTHLLNPTWLPLAFHRLIGDLILAGFIIAGYGAWRFGRPADAQQRPYYGYVAWAGLMVGVVTLLLQPFSGLLYASRIQASVPEAYEQLVRGAYQWLVVLQFSLIGLLFTGSYVLLRMNVSRRVRWTDAVFVVSAIFLVVSVGHTAIRRTWLYVLVLLMSWALWQRGTSETDQLPGGSVRRPVMIGLGAVALLTYLTMGTIRETARRPDTVRNLISLQDEVRNPAALRGTPENNMDLRTQQME